MGEGIGGKGKRGVTTGQVEIWVSGDECISDVMMVTEGIGRGGEISGSMTGVWGKLEVDRGK